MTFAPQPVEQWRTSHILRLAILVVLAAVLPAAWLAPVAQATTASAHHPTTAVSGQVLNARILSTPAGATVVIPDGLHPVANAEVSMVLSSGLTVRVRTDRSGRFALARPAGLPGNATATVSVRAAGFGGWRETGVPVNLAHGNYPILTVELGSGPRTRAYPRDPSVTGRLSPASGSGSGGAADRKVSARGGCTGYSSSYRPPVTIRVDNVSTGTVQTYDFEYYVENVLPNEWIASWPAAALEAGAVAVKTYGWYWINNWRGGSLKGTCYDAQGGRYANGTCDVDYQCFVPGTATSSTTDQVENTWNWIAQQRSEVFEASYNSGFRSDACGQYDGTAASGQLMSQWGTVACSNDGYGWRRIVTTYYRPDVAFLTPEFTGSWQQVCDAGANALCLTDAGDAQQRGTPIKLDAGPGDQAGAEWRIYQVSDCGGSVTANCPFSRTSWDSSYLGDPIVIIASAAVPGCAASRPGDPAKVGLEDCALTESLWVDARSSHATAAFINVERSDAVSNGHPQALTGAGTADDRAGIANWDNRYLQGWNW